MVKGTTRVSRVYILVGAEDQLGRCRHHRIHLAWTTKFLLDLVNFVEFSPVSRPVSMGNINKSPSLKARHQLDRPQLAVEIGFILNFSWVNFSCSSSSTKFFCSK